MNFTGCGHELHAVLDVGTRDAGGGLRPERPALAVLVPWREQEQLLLDDVRRLADPALEDLDALEQRRRDRVVAVARGEIRTERLQAAEREPILRQEVARATRRSECWHRQKSRSTAQAIEG